VISAPWPSNSCTRATTSIPHWLSVCVSDTAKPGGFYLLTIKGSEQEGAPKGSILRKVVVDKTRSSLETALASIKKTVEQSVPASER
jgi:hypothetical protein